MKFLLLLLPLLAFSKAKSFDLKQIADDLNVKVAEDGNCLFTRNQINNVQLHNRFDTPLKDRVLVLRNEPLEPYWNCIYLKRNFRRDSIGYFITNEELERSLIEKSDKTVQVSGKIRYVGLVKKKYRYDLINEDGIITAVVKVHFDMSKITQYTHDGIRRDMDNTIAKAENIWNSMAPDKYRFKFIQVRKKEESFFSVKLLSKDTRGPYDTRWSMLWSDRTIAHEFGHMLGLDDEYDQITGSMLGGVNRLLINRSNGEHLHDFSDRYNFGHIKAMRCDMNSMMCNHYRGKFNAWHFYTIFKRFFQ